MAAKSNFFFIVNLIAGQGRCKEIFPKVKLELDRRKIQYDLHFTNEPMEAVDVAKMGIEAGFSHIVAMGGDGTFNEVANGLLGSDAMLAVIPAGTGNDFIRMLGIPSNPMQAIDTLLDGTTRTMDLGQVGDDRCFVNGLGIGLDAQVARGRQPVAGQHPQKRGLARPVRADQPEDLPRDDLDAEAVEGDQLPESLGDSLRFDLGAHRVLRGRKSASRREFTQNELR